MVVRASACPFQRGKAGFAPKLRATTDRQTDGKVQSNQEVHLDPPKDEYVQMLSLWGS